MAPIACCACAAHMGKFKPSWLPNPKVSHSAFTTMTPQFSVRCIDEKNKKNKKKRLSEQSSWEAEDAEGRDYLYRLGKEADNMNIAVGQRDGIIDHLFAGNFLGKDSDIVFDYRQKVTRSFQYLQGDYYIAPLFLVISPFHFPFFSLSSVLGWHTN